MSDAGSELSRLRVLVIDGPDAEALAYRDALLERAHDVVPTLADLIADSKDEAVRVRATWLAKDTADARLWPSLQRAVLSPEPTLHATALDTLERHAFADSLPAEAVAALAAELPRPRDDAPPRAWVALMASMGTSTAREALDAFVRATERDADVLALLAEHPNEAVRTTLQTAAASLPHRSDLAEAVATAAASRTRAEADGRLQRGEPMDELVDRLVAARQWAVLLRAVNADAVAASQRQRLAKLADVDGASKPQRKLLRRLREAAKGQD